MRYFLFFSGLFAVPSVGFKRLRSRGTPDDDASAKKLEAVVAGLSKVVGDNSKLDHSALKDSLIAPFVDQVSTILRTVKAGKLSAAEKKQKIAEANQSMENLAMGMAKRGQDLMNEAQEDKTNLLMGVLLSRKGSSLAEQYSVLEDPEFARLDVVQYVKTQKGKDHRALVEQCGEFLDHPKELTKEQKSEQKKKNAIKSLQTKIMAMAKRLKEGKQSGHMTHVQQALTAEAIKHMQKALKAVKSGDHSEIQSAEAAMVKTLKRMQNGLKDMEKAAVDQTMTVLLQTGARTGLEKDCPYCKAQCFEKCHAGGSTYTECLKECAEEKKFFL